MLITIPGELGELVRDRRKQLGISQQSLAEIVGVSRHWVIALERGNSGAELGLVFKALRAVGLRVDVRGSDAVEDGAAALSAAVAEVIERTVAGHLPRRLRLSTRRRP